MTATQHMVRDIAEHDRAESLLRNIDSATTPRTGISLFHILALASIVASIALFVSGRKTEAIFVGLWPPTFEALKSAAEKM
ncbi:MAG TPA: hypothetical protein VFF68_04215 [Anaerolineaceae bacterium]|nr:hypothetical protein [Anaerolineaceae bacterium]